MGGFVAFSSFLLVSSPAATFRLSVTYQSVFSFGETSFLSQTVKRFADPSPKHFSLAAIGGRLMCFYLLKKGWPLASLSTDSYNSRRRRDRKVWRPKAASPGRLLSSSRRLRRLAYQGLPRRCLCGSEFTPSGALSRT